MQSCQDSTGPAKTIYMDKTCKPIWFIFSFLFSPHALLEAVLYLDGQRWMMMPAQKWHGSGGEGWAELLGPLCWDKWVPRKARAKPQDFMFHTILGSKIARDGLSSCAITFLTCTNTK